VKIHAWPHTVGSKEFSDTLCTPTEALALAQAANGDAVAAAAAAAAEADTKGAALQAHVVQLTGV